MCTEQNVTVGVPEIEGRRRRPRTTSRTLPEVPLLVESSLKARTIGSGSNVEQDGEVRVATIRNGLIGDVGDTTAGFLKNNRMEPSTSRRDNFGGVPARQAWIPLKNRETVLMMHEVAISCVNASKPVRFGVPEFDHGKNQDPRFGKRTTSRTRVCTDGIVGSRKGGTCTPLVGS